MMSLFQSVEKCEGTCTVSTNIRTAQGFFNHRFLGKKLEGFILHAVSLRLSSRAYTGKIHFVLSTPTGSRVVVELSCWQLICCLSRTNTTVRVCDFIDYVGIVGM